LKQHQIDRHIGWDIGAQGVCEHLSRLLNAPLVLQTHSRLLYDCNRPPTAKSAIIEFSEDTPIPGNQQLSAIQKQARANEIYYPFHRTITDLLDKRSHHIDSIIVTIHSFNPIYKGLDRALDIGIINDLDSTWAANLTRAAQANKQLIVKLNEPYSAADGVTHTLQLHGRNRQLANVMIEINNALITKDQGQGEFASILASLLNNNKPN
jgi:predicted N-formylglutamate amidohydrolase